jgi:hypothetical protein
VGEGRVSRRWWLWLWHLHSQLDYPACCAFFGKLGRVVSGSLCSVVCFDLARHVLCLVSKSGVIILPGRLFLISWGQNQVARAFNSASDPQSHSKLPEYNMGRVMVPGEYEVDLHCDVPLHRHPAATSNQSALPPVLHTPTAIFVWHTLLLMD